MNKYLKKVSIILFALLLFFGMGINQNRTIIYAATTGSAQTVSSLRIDPAAADRMPGQQQQLKVIATMNDGSTKDVTAGSNGTVYKTSNTGFAKVDSNGLVTVLQTAPIGYSATITANYAGQTAKSTINIVSDPSTTLDHISVTPATAIIARGEQVQLKVIATMRDGSTKDVTSGNEGTVYYSPSPGVANVDANGLVSTEKGIPIGATVSIMATYRGLHAYCLISFNEEPTVVSLSVTPEEAKLMPGGQKQLQVIATMSDGTTKDVTAGSNGTVYTSSRPTIGTVDENGLVTIFRDAPLDHGTFIYVTYGGITVSSEIWTGTDTTN